MLKTRNPFPKIWNVMKYDFQYSARTFLPVYAVLIVLAVLKGIFSKSIVSVNASENGIQMYSQATSFATFALGFFFFIFYVAAFVLTIIILTKRYKQSMLGDEAYLNLSLPVTIGEHLWGHFLISLFWFICCNVLTVLAFYLAFHKDISSEWFSEFLVNLKEEFFDSAAESSHIKPVGFITMSILIALTINSLYITFVFAINSIGHLFGRNKTPAKILAIIVLVFLYSKLSNIIFNVGKPENFLSFAWMYITYNLAYIAAFFAASWAILKYKLNLE